MDSRFNRVYEFLMESAAVEQGPAADAKVVLHDLETEIEVQVVGPELTIWQGDRNFVQFVVHSEEDKAKLVEAVSALRPKI